MKPFSKEISSLYLQTAPLWEWKPDSHGDCLGSAVQLAWQQLFDQELDIDNLPEPYDMEGGDILYVFPFSRYLLISAKAEGIPRSHSCAEIREKQPFYFLNEGAAHERVRSTFFSRTDEEAKMRLASEIIPSLQEPLQGSWTLYKRFQPGAEPEIVMKGA